MQLILTKVNRMGLQHLTQPRAKSGTVSFKELILFIFNPGQTL